MTDLIKTFGGNNKGRDFFIGDIHGCFDGVLGLMNQVGFDEAVDRMFSVGDLVDRGPQSAKAIEWLQKPWFHAVRANHEQMALDWADNIGSDDMWILNGGRWFFELPDEDKCKFVELVRRLPFLIEIDDGEVRVGVVHAEPVFSDWETLKSRIREDRVQTEAIWGRTRITAKLDTDVKSVSAVVCGHTPSADVIQLGNVFYIDTGAVFGKKLTMLELTPDGFATHQIATTK